MHSEINDPDTYHFFWFLCHEGFAQNLGQENEPPGILFVYLVSERKLDVRSLTQGFLPFFF